MWYLVFHSCGSGSTCVCIFPVVGLSIKCCWWANTHQPGRGTPMWYRGNGAMNLCVCHGTLVWSCLWTGEKMVTQCGSSTQAIWCMMSLHRRSDITDVLWLGASRKPKPCSWIWLMNTRCVWFLWWSIVAHWSCWIKWPDWCMVWQYVGWLSYGVGYIDLEEWLQYKVGFGVLAFLWQPDCALLQLCMDSLSMEPCNGPCNMLGLVVCCIMQDVAVPFSQAIWSWTRCFLINGELEEILQILSGCWNNKFCVALL